MHVNSTWTVIAALGHNLARWTTLTAFLTRLSRPAAARRRRLAPPPDPRPTDSHQPTLDAAPARSLARQHDFTIMLDATRTLPALT
jgi:hypothetical protein